MNQACWYQSRHGVACSEVSISNVYFDDNLLQPLTLVERCMPQRFLHAQKRICINVWTKVVNICQCVPVVASLVNQKVTLCTCSYDRQCQKTSSACAGQICTALQQCQKYTLQYTAAQLYNYVQYICQSTGDDGARSLGQAQHEQDH